MTAFHDVVIVGAGPAGSTVADRLARAGVDVGMVEEHAVVGEPVDCTGVLGAEAIERFGLPERIVLGAIEAITLHSPGGVPITHSAGTPIAYVVDRAALDRGLAADAPSAGATLYLGTRAVRAVRQPRGISVLCRQTDGTPREFFAAVLVLAGGPQFALHAQLGLGDSPVLWQSAHAELAGNGLAHPQVYVGQDVAPGAFAWAVPVRRGGRPFVRVGVNSHADAPRYLHRLCTERFPHLMAGAHRPAVRCWVVPVVPAARTYGERVLAVGDAAGQVKPTSGGGIYYGMLAAELAAESVIEAFRKGAFGPARFADYEKRWRGLLGRDLRLGSLLRRLFGRMADRDVDDLFRVLQSEIGAGRVAGAVSFDWHRNLVLFLLRHPTLVRLLLRSYWSRGDAPDRGGGGDREIERAREA
jgi:geranylgeranyl reductase family protein